MASAILPVVLSFYSPLAIVRVKLTQFFFQGYLSFWNDNISYALRGCILIELALRRRIALVKDPHRRRLPVSERLVEVIDERQTGETILDEALKMIKSQGDDKLGINSWIDLLSGKYPGPFEIVFFLQGPFPALHIIFHEELLNSKHLLAH